MSRTFLVDTAGVATAEPVDDLAELMGLIAGLIMQGHVSDVTMTISPDGLLDVRMMYLPPIEHVVINISV